MSRRLQHGINMGNFISQVSTEHHLVDELVTNAIEAAASRVEILHTGKRLTIFNDGRSLNLEEIEKTLLTAFETGEEKSLETNRGLGFIALYPAASSAVIRTGVLRVDISDWQEIEARQADYQQGFEISIELNQQAQQQYSPTRVQQHLDHWISWEEISISFGTEPGDLQRVGQYFKGEPPFHKHPKYPYANLRYYEGTFKDGSSLQVIYQLTGVEVYRLLPIDLELETFSQLRENEVMTLVVSHGAYLDSSRRSLTDWGRQQVAHLIGLLDQDDLVDQFRRKTFRFRSEIIRYCKHLLAELEEKYQLEVNIDKTLKLLQQQMTSNHEIIKHTVYLDKLLALLQFAQPPRQPDSLLNSVYQGYEEMVSKHLPEITPQGFHDWVEQNLQCSLIPCFESTVVGFLLDHGDISDQVTLGELLLGNDAVIRFDNQLFQTAVIHRTRLIVLLHDQVEYFSRLDHRFTDLEELIQLFGQVKPLDSQLEQFSLGRSDDTSLSEDNLDFGRERIIHGIPVMVNHGQELDGEQQDFLESRGKELYQLWREVVSLVLDAYNHPLQEEITPVLVLSDSQLACVVHSYVGISLRFLQNLDLNRRVLLLYAAIHEVTHLFCRPHSHRFYQVQSQIYLALVGNQQLTQFISTPAPSDQQFIEDHED